MGKTIDDAQVPGSQEADRADPGEPATAGSDRTTSDDGMVAGSPAAGSTASGSTVTDPRDGARVELPTRRQLRLQMAQGRAVAPDSSSSKATAETPDVRDPERDDPIAVGPAREPLPGGRRDRRRRQAAGTASMHPASSEPPTTASVAGGGPHASAEMGIEAALAAREALVRDARNHAGVLQAGDDPFAVDPDVLAQQKALAERAAVLNARARRVQEVAEQVQARRPLPDDPTTPYNLSIVAPLEFLRGPGGVQAGLRAPMTTHIPIVLPLSAPEPTAVRRPEGADGEGGPEVIRSDVPGQSGPIEARSAFGLEPLDAMTAGLGRMRRVRYIQYSFLGVGAAALATGIIMTVSSLNG